MERTSETGCCPRFDPKPWDEKGISWKEKPFVKDRVLTFFRIPLNMGGVVVRNMKKIEAAGAAPEQQLMLYDDKSLFGADVYIAVGKDVPGARMERVSGTFLGKVFEGHYKNMGKWAKEMREYVKSKGAEIKKLYFCYTTCPGCAKFYGKNYVVLLARV